MKIAIYKNTCARAGVPVMDAFIHSLSSENVKTFNENKIIDCDLAVIWAILWQNKNRKIIWNAYKQKNIPIIVLEVGGLKRNVTWKVGLNGINNDAKWANENSPPNRWDKLGIQLSPWKTDGDYIVICGQNDQSGAWPSGLKTETYIYDTVQKIRQHTQREIVIRPHPRARFNTNKIQNHFSNISISIPQQYTGTYDDFDFDKVISKAWAVVSYNSNPGIEAIIKGIPVFCDQSSLASPVGNLDLSMIETPLRPDRKQWCYDIAYTEWTKDEIQQGLPWARLQKTFG